MQSWLVQWVNDECEWLCAVSGFFECILCVSEWILCAVHSFLCVHGFLCAVGERLISDNCKQILPIDIPSTLNLEPIPSSSILYTLTSTSTLYSNLYTDSSTSTNETNYSNLSLL